MPMPERQADESKDQFIDRCMASPTMLEEFPDAAQRRAVCERQASAEGAGPLTLITEPGGITIEAAAASDKSDAPKLARFSMIAYTGGPMRIGGWRYPVIVDLAGLGIPSQSRPVRFGHDALSGVGHTTTIAVEDGRLIASGVVSRDTEPAREVVASAKRGFPWQASIGASVEQFEFVKEEQSVLVNGREFSGPVNVVRKATLGEISFVDIGADANTSAKVAAKAIGESNMADEIKSVQTEPQEPPKVEATLSENPLGEVTQAIRTERKRRADIAAVARTYILKPGADIDTIERIAGEAISKGLSASEFELALLRGLRPVLPPTMPDGPVTEGRVMEAALCLAGKLPGVEKQYEPRILEEASRRWRYGLGIGEMLVIAAQRGGGRHITSLRDTRGILEGAFAPDIRAGGYSTIDIGGILSNVANKFLLAGFMAVEQTWRQISAIEQVTDFKTRTSYRLIGKDQYEKVAPGGEIKHGDLGEESYTNKADTYGLLLTIDRRDIINDDLGALTSVPRKLGRGSGLKINDVFWTAFLDNGTFFAAGNKNIVTANPSLGIAGLTVAEQVFMDLLDGDGKPTGINPSILLVPTGLSALANQLYKSTEIRDTSTADYVYPTANPHSGKFRVAVSRYIGNTAYSGGDVDGWYLLADPNDLPVIETVFLNGQESPTIETADVDFNRLGIQLRGYHDFGVALQDPKAGVKSTSAGS